MKQPLVRDVSPARLCRAAIVLGLAALFCAARIDLPLLEPEEARYAEIPRQMLVRDRFLIPIHDGHNYLDKPPLLYWLVVGSYRLFGVHEWSARLPTAVAAWLTVAIILGWGWRTAGFDAGIVGAAMLTLTGDFVYRAPMLTMNGPLALFVAASLACGHIAIRNGLLHWRWWLASAAACALGILTKGPVAAVLIAVPLFAWPWLDRSLARPTRRSWLAWVGIALALAGPWFAAVAARQPGFIAYFFWKHHVERFGAPFDHAGPPWAYLPQIAMGFMPWTLVAAGLAWRRSVALGLPLSQYSGGAGRGHVEPYEGSRVKQTLILALSAAVWGFAFFSLAGSKRPVYLVPIEPPLALAAGTYFWHARARLGKSLWLALGLTTALALGVGITLWLPAYSQLFSIAPMVRLAQDAELSPDVPVFCYGHGWDSVGFYLERDDVQTFLGSDRAAIGRALASHGRSLVFATTKRDGDDFIERLPAGFSFRLLGANRYVRVGVVVPPENALSGKP